jgi:hypothetical protein
MATWGGAPTWGTYATWSDDTDGGTTITRYFLTSPVREIGPASRDRYMELLRNRTGLTVVKRDGEWLTVRNKRQEWLDECDAYFRGGYDNEVTSEQRTELIAAGFTVESRTQAGEGPNSGYAWGDIALWTGRQSW